MGISVTSDRTQTRPAELHVLNKALVTKCCLKEEVVKKQEEVEEHMIDLFYYATMYFEVRKICPEG